MRIRTLTPCNRAFFDKNIDLALHGGDRIALFTTDAQTRHAQIALNVARALPRGDRIVPKQRHARPSADPSALLCQRTLPRGARIAWNGADALHGGRKIRLERPCTA